MTVDDMRELAHICGGNAALTPDVLARECLRHYRMHREALERLTTARDDRRQLMRELDGALRRRPGVKQVEEERDRYRELYEVALKRNEVLNAKLKGAAA